MNMGVVAGSLWWAPGFGHSKKEKRTHLPVGLSSPLDFAMTNSKEMFVRTGVV